MRIQALLALALGAGLSACANSVLIDIPDGINAPTGPIKYSHEKIGLYSHYLKIHTKREFDEPRASVVLRMDSFANRYASTICPYGFDFNDNSDPPGGLTDRLLQTQKNYSFTCF
ncbi:hypothetical protein FG93_04808 [Bosea sp. LC85]|uniref:hypothetical protein n=1 Tax=Bosea sp. LC85 TaxID=1502851 RepID=UPI0004E29D74|nr:hypothetical protein [Bosea sp. LC85]KFC65267.1 hypothetical protein FG93_04808 [Bosea sp. LC85]